MEILWLIAYYVISAGGYYYFSRIPTNNHLLTVWDKYIPTVPIFIVPYLFLSLAYLFLPIIFLFKLECAKVKEYLSAQIIAQFISFAVFYFYSTSVVRDSIAGSDIFSNALRYLHSIDRPSAAFPSGHVFQSIIIGYFLWIWYPKTRPYIIVVLPLVIASTVLLKQHYLPDILGGIIVAVIAIYLTKILTPKLL